MRDWQEIIFFLLDLSVAADELVSADFVQTRCRRLVTANRRNFMMDGKRF